MQIFRYGKAKIVEKVQFTLGLPLRGPAFKTIFNAAIAEEMLRAQHSL